MLKIDIGGFFKEHFCNTVKFYIIFAVFIIGGIVLGIISANNISILSNDNIKLLFFNKIYINISFFTAFFGNTFIMLTLFCVIIAVNINIFLLPINFVFLLYRGYLAGFTLVAIIKIYGGGGIVNLIIIFIPIQLVMLFFLAACSAACMRRLMNNLHNGPFCFRGTEYHLLLRELITLFIIFFVINLGLTIIVFITTKAFLTAF